MKTQENKQNSTISENDSNVHFSQMSDSDCINEFDHVVWMGFLAYALEHIRKLSPHNKIPGSFWQLVGLYDFYPDGVLPMCMRGICFNAKNINDLGNISWESACTHCDYEVYVIDSNTTEALCPREVLDRAASIYRHKILPVRSQKRFSEAKQNLENLIYAIWTIPNLNPSNADTDNLDTDNIAKTDQIEISDPLSEN